MTNGTDPQMLEGIVFDHMSTLGPERSQITPEATLEDLEIDSLDVVELAQMVEADTGVEIELERFVGSKTAGDIARTVAAIVAESTVRA